jgi:16S rRNA (uracil1498-N3)-methyltransferase
MTRRIYTSSPLSLGSDIELDEAAAHHISRVLRMRTGDKVSLFNGDGQFYQSELTEVGKRHVYAKVETATRVDAESPVHTHLGQVLSKGERMDYAIQKATEMGVCKITPLTSERCDVRLNDERGAKRQQHWQQVAISAAEQCGRAKIPLISPIQSVDEWITEKASDTLGLVLHHRTHQQLTDLTPPKKVWLLIGPEGGLTAEEITKAESKGFVATTLGKRVLRTETAPVAALSIIQWLWGDYQ